MKKILSFGIVALMVCVSFSLVSWDAASEEVTGPFAARDVGYPLLITGEDQVQDNATYNFQINSTLWIYQTFRPGVTGNLNRVSFYLTGSTGTGNVHVCLYHTDQGGYLQTQIASTTTDAFTDGWQDVVFTPEPALNQGVEYAFKLSADGTKQVHWHDSGANNYLSGQMYNSNDAGETYTPQNTDMAFKTYMEYNTGGIKKVAWHSSGDFALGVTGADTPVYRYERRTGAWNPFLSLNPGEVMHDIVYDPQPGWDLFYMVGQDTGTNQPLAYEYDHNLAFMQPRPMVMSGAFYGVERSNDGGSNFTYLAVGVNTGTDLPLMAWWEDGVGWKTVSSGPVSGDVLLDACWDRAGTYYAVGRDSGNKGVVYSLTVGNDVAMRLSFPTNMGTLNAIDWNDNYTNHNWAIMAGENIGTGNIWKFDGSVVTPLHNNPGDVFHDLDFYPFGPHMGKCHVVGEDGSGNGIVCTVNPGSPKNVARLSVSGFPLYGIACKGPTSPSSAIITGGGGAVGLYADALDQDTGIIINAVVPKLFSIDLIDSTSASRLDDQVPVDAWYNITLVANYSEGWSNCIVMVRAWHDGGDIEADPGGSNYPLETVYNRNLAFNITWTVGGAPNAVVNYPDSDLEILSGAVTDTDLAVPFPIGDDRNNHEVRISLYLGNQVRAADGGGFAVRDPKFSQDKNILLHRNSWDLEVTVRDAGNPTAFNTSYAEFGVHKLVSISVSGNPSGSAPPGASNVPLINPSRITYSANTDYWVNVSIPNVGLGGDPLAVDNIPATDVFVANVNNLASQEYTELNYTDFPTGRAFQGADVRWCVWGNRSEIVPFMPAPGNGTTAFGPWGSNYNLYGNPSGETRLRWWVTIQATTREGVYSAIITITLES